MASTKNKSGKGDIAEYKPLIATTSYSAIQNLPNQIDALNRIYLQFDYDDNKTAQSSLSQLYVISLCTFVEAFVRSAYSSYIMRNYNNTHESQLRHLAGELAERLNDMPWEALKKSDIIYLERKLSNSITDSIHYKTVNIMFKLRNLIVHGNDFQVDLFSADSEVEYQVGGQAKNIYQYLIERKVFTANEITDTTHLHLNRESICLFIDETLEFANKFSDFISTELKFDQFFDLETFGISEMKNKIKLYQNKK